MIFYLTKAKNLKTGDILGATNGVTLHISEIKELENNKKEISFSDIGPCTLIVDNEQTVLAHFNFEKSQANEQRNQP